MASRGRIAIAGMAAILCASACPAQPVRMDARQSDGTDLAQRLRGWQDPDRRVCAVDRLAESRLPRTTCRTVQQWRDRQHRGLSRE